MLFFAACFPIQASTVVIDYQGDTVVRQKNVERNLIVRSEDSGVYDIAIKPLDNALKSYDGSVLVPLENVYINNTKEDVYLRYNEYSNLFKNLEMGGIAQNITAKVRDYGMLPAGSYSLNFEIQTTDSETQTVVSTSIFTLQFIVPVVQEVSINSELPKIVVNATDAFDPQKKIVNESPSVVNINSNSDWVLSIYYDNLSEIKGNYYVRTISASPNVFERLQERVLLENCKEIPIAKGKAPADNEFVSVELSLKSADGKYIPAGNYENRVKYILREEVK